MKGVELYARVRRAVCVEGLSRRETTQRFGIDPRTVAPAARTSSRWNSVTGKSHIALGLGLAACQKGLLVGSPPPPAWCTSCSRPGTRSVLRLQRQLAGNKLLVGLPRGAREFLLDVLVVGEIYRMSLLE